MPMLRNHVNVKSDFMALMCFRKKTNLRRSPSMKNSDSFSAKRMTVARVCCWYMKSSFCPFRAQQFLSQVTHGFLSSFYVHTCCQFSPGISSLLSLLICWLHLSFFSTSGPLVLPYNMSFLATQTEKSVASWNGNIRGKANSSQWSVSLILLGFGAMMESTVSLSWCYEQICCLISHEIFHLFY